ncbi:hypothetical protein HH308_27745 [Gordonia sp. TBRC 11910]|uniref:Uncharacterized protein n=1 Tax=Gordonia asplenii TaxID=2725283 RepID=A0A848L1X8_9ACTN|nr:hypothetical protein [Gordonia asplenii]NMO05020.1 hypothetical protein [Gordonia asplenii]
MEPFDAALRPITMPRLSPPSDDQARFHADYLERIPIAWGWDLVADIPLPPFRSRSEFDRFLTHLREHVARSTKATSARSMAVVSEVIDEARTRRRPRREIPLTATELAATFIVNFPAPWTVPTLAAALRGAGTTMTLDAADRWTLVGPPRIMARPTPEGGWHTTVFDDKRRRRCLLDDREFVILVMQHHLQLGQSPAPCPLGWALGTRELTRAIPRAIASRLTDGRRGLTAEHAEWIAHQAICYAADPMSVSPADIAELRRLRALSSAQARTDRMARMSDRSA